MGGWHRIKSESIWNPDIQVGNRLRGQIFEEDSHEAHISFKLGAIKWGRIFRTRVLFNPDVRGYPYDIQAILFKVYSESYLNTKFCFLTVMKV